ncbi:MAG: hypothetical protein ACOCWM_05720, partial [Cyclobacteriaceae bacterium]
MKNLIAIFMAFFVVTTSGQQSKEISNANEQSNIEFSKEFEKNEKLPHNFEKENFCPIKHQEQYQKLINPDDTALLKSNKGNLQLDSIYRYDFESESDSVLSSKEVYSYNAEGKMTFWERYNWDISNQEWVGVNKYEYEYDSEGNKSLEI